MFVCEQKKNQKISFRITGVLTNFPGDSIDKIEQLQRPRHIKSHLTRSLLPNQLWTKKPRIIYVARNPKDVVISFYHHYRNIVGYRGTKEDFIEAFLNDSIIYSPFFAHILEFWQVRHENNILFLTYEGMKADIKSVLRQVAAFFGKSFSDAAIDGLADHLSVDSMRSKSYFIIFFFFFFEFSLKLMNF
jgi:sulfotransferase